MLTQTEFDAVSVEAHYKGELARMVKRLEKAEQDLSEARNSAKWLSLQVKTLERERDELKKFNANLEKVRTDRRYMHALEVIKDLLNGRAHQQMVNILSCSTYPVCRGLMPISATTGRRHSDRCQSLSRDRR